MSDYISRDALMAVVKTERNQLVLGKTAAQKLEKYIKAAPAADVAPVVRCEDCKWFGQSRLGGGWCNEVMARPMPPDGFCSYGERKESSDERDHHGGACEGAAAHVT